MSVKWWPLNSKIHSFSSTSKLCRHINTQNHQHKQHHHFRFPFIWFAHQTNSISICNHSHFNSKLNWTQSPLCFSKLGENFLIEERSSYVEVQIGFTRWGKTKLNGSMRYQPAPFFQFICHLLIWIDETTKNSKHTFDESCFLFGR